MIIFVFVFTFIYIIIIMSYYNWPAADNNTGEVNGGNSYNRDPRLSSTNTTAAQAQYSGINHAQAQQSDYNYAAVDQQYYQADQNYSNQYPASTPVAPSAYPITDPAYPNYSPQSSQTPYYSQSYQYPQQSSTYTQQTPYYDQQQYYQQQTSTDSQSQYQPHQQQSYQSENQQSQSHYAYDLSLPDEIEQENCMTTRSDEELWVEAWLARLGKIQIKLDSTVVVSANKNRSLSPSRNNPVKLKQRVISTGKCPKISEARGNLSKSFRILSSIESIHQHLDANLSTLTSDEWRLCTVEIGALRDELTVLMTPFEGENFINLKRTVKMRRKKRFAQKRQKVMRRKVREKEHEGRVKKHEEIDGWLERENAEVLRMQEEEAAKGEADIILADTTRKKLDAKRNLALVQSLTKLRDVREKAALGRGEQTSAQDSYAFQNLAERLQDIWTNASKEYGKEEHRLRTQLEQTTSEDQRKAKLEREKKVTDDWSKALFGDPLKEGEESGLFLGLTAAERSVDTFIAIRKSWDTFLAKSDDILGTKVPIGWVLPKEHVSDKWSQYLQLNPS